MRDHGRFGSLILTHPKWRVEQFSWTTNSSRKHAVGGWKASYGFAGEYRQGETPVPIPNTAVKPLSPMILLRGKVGHRRLHGSYQSQLVGPSLFFGCMSAVWVSLFGLGRLHFRCRCLVHLRSTYTQPWHLSYLLLAFMCWLWFNDDVPWIRWFWFERRRIGVVVCWFKIVSRGAAFAAVRTWWRLHDAESLSRNTSRANV